MIAKTPNPPYYAVIFCSVRTEGDNGYSRMAEQMVELAEKQSGFLGVESARNELGITVSYWKQNAEHTIARHKGRKLWFRNFKTRIAKVETDYAFDIGYQQQHI